MGDHGMDLAGLSSRFGTPSSPTLTTPNRTHRTKLSRNQVACERCRKRKNKCDGQFPECSQCRKAGVACIIVDRSTYREYPRGHVDALEKEVQHLRASNQELSAQNDTLSAQLEAAKSSSGPNIESAAATQNLDTPGSGTLTEIISHLPLDAQNNRKYLGDSSGLFFGNIVEKTLLRSDYKHEQGPSQERLRLRVGERHISQSPRSSTQAGAEDIFPSPELTERMQATYFCHRWPALPCLHRPTFLEQHLRPVMEQKFRARHVSLFLTFMVFALATIDLRLQDPTFPDLRLVYFNLAVEQYLHGLLDADNHETVQGLLLTASFAINEHRSANAWQVAGQAMRLAIELGLHRNLRSSARQMLDSEMRKRIFWSAYALDRNISITLGRPCALHDSDIDLALPLCLSDDELLSGEVRDDIGLPPRSNDTSAFIHIVKLRQLQSRIQQTLYPAGPSHLDDESIENARDQLRVEVEEWRSQIPRIYEHRTLSTFQSSDWFEIAYSHALLLLHRPCPANPVVKAESLQICLDSAVDLIQAYSSLYSKKKITYTWIALHSLFMASVTMLHALWVSPETRAATRESVVKANLMACLALFDVMGDFWPQAARCYDIVDRLGVKTAALFAAPGPPPTPPSTAAGVARHPERGQIDDEYSTWFGTRDRRAQGSAASGARVVGAPAPAEEPQSRGQMPADSIMPFADDGHMWLSPDDLFLEGFDLTIPMMTDAFFSGPDLHP